VTHQANILGLSDGQTSYSGLCFGGFLHEPTASHVAKSRMAKFWLRRIAPFFLGLQKNCMLEVTEGLCLRFKGIEYLPTLHNWAQSCNYGCCLLPPKAAM